MVVVRIVFLIKISIKGFSIVLCQYDIVRHSVTMVFGIKAQYAGKGHSCNAVSGRHGNALWVGLSVPIGYVMSFGNRTTITCKACLAMNTDKLTEPDNIKLAEYQEKSNEKAEHTRSM